MAPAFNHPEDVKGAIRKRFGSVAAFERARGLPPLSVRDILRGKKRGGIARVVAKELGIPLTDLDVFQGYSHNRDNSIPPKPAHRQNARAK